jgi:ribonuclease D
LIAAVSEWARERQHREVTARSKPIATREADALAGLRNAATEARLLIDNRTARASALRDIANAQRAIRRGAAERRRQYDNPGHRPDERAFRAACRASAKRHRVPISTVADVIVTRIAATLPEAHRTALLGPWRSIEEQRKHLTDRLLRAR